MNQAKLWIKIWSFSLCCVGLIGFTKPTIAQTTQETDSSNLTIMSYNVENLFDTNHDAGKDDWEFLPKGYPGRDQACGQLPAGEKARCLENDWTPARLKVKLGNISRVLHAVSPNLPDLLIMAEVENKNVAMNLAQVAGYDVNNVIVGDSPDKRGIRVAMIYKSSKLKLNAMREHAVSGSHINKPTRNILEAEFTTFGGDKLFVFGNHWPSQAAPAVARVDAAEVLADRTKEILQSDPSAKIIAMGDFNTIPSDHPNPFETVLYEQTQQRTNLFQDIHDAFMASPSISAQQKAAMSPGSYYYPTDRVWNMFDHFFVSNGLLSGQGAKLTLNSFNIFKQDFMLRPFVENDGNLRNQGSPLMIPKRYNFNADDAANAGFSDHLPIVVKISR